MSIINTLITNRTSGSTYKFTDLNRVETAFEYLQNKMNDEHGFNLRLFIKKDWTRQDLGQLGAQTLMEQYRQNVVQIRNAIAVLKTTPSPPNSMRFLTHKEANDIEKILIDIDTLLTNAEKVWHYSGEFYCGEV